MVEQVFVVDAAFEEVGGIVVGIGASIAARG